MYHTRGTSYIGPHPEFCGRELRYLGIVSDNVVDNERRRWYIRTSSVQLVNLSTYLCTYQKSESVLLSVVPYIHLTEAKQR